MHFGRSSPLPARACQAWRNRAGAHLRRPNPSRARARSILPPPGPGFFPCWRTPPTRLDAPPRHVRNAAEQRGRRRAFPLPGFQEDAAGDGGRLLGLGRQPLPLPWGLDWDKLVRGRPFRPVERGENLLHGASVPAPLLYRERGGDTWVARPLQLYLDLRAWPRRGREQAIPLREVCLGSWGGPSRNRPRATLRSRPSSASARSSPSCAAAGPGLRRLDGAQGGPGPRKEAP